MALRAENSAQSSSSSSHLVGLPVFWSDAVANPPLDWDKWFDLFQVAIMADYSISITELTRNVDQQNPKVRALLGDLDEDPANKKVIIILYLSLGEPARKQSMDKNPHTALWDLKAQELVNLCIECFGCKPFYMEGTMCGNYFKAIIDTGSPVSIFTKSDLQKFVEPRKVVIRDMIAGERYVDYNKKALNLLC